MYQAHLPLGIAVVPFVLKKRKTMHAELQIVSPTKGEKYVLMPGEYIILGRGDTADIVFGDDPSLSRLHCKVFYQEKNFWIEDLGSRNHSFVNQKPVTKQILKHKDKIYIGRYQILFQLVEDKDSTMSEREPFTAIKNTDKLTGRIAYELKLITKENLKACVKVQEEMAASGPYYPLSEILIQEGLVTQNDLDRIENFKKQIPFRIQNYKLQELIGMGGMGRIYLARCLKTGALRACKIFCQFAEDFQSQVQEQFQREAQALLKFDHVNIVKGFEKGDVDKAMYLVMEYIDGITLKAYLKEKSDRLLADEALDIVIQIARALEHAHIYGMVHRDIKPDNVMITKEKVVKLCDFGLVKSTQAETQEENVFGTVAYMSPEQIRGAKNIDIRSDIYSLGVLFYRVLFGKLPFVGDSKRICKQHLLENIHFPRESQHPQKKELSKIIRKMMSKAPESRYPSPKELLYDLEIAKAMFFQKDLGKTEEVPYSRKNLGTTSRIALSRSSRIKKAAIVFLCLLVIAMSGAGIFIHKSKTDMLSKVVASMEAKDYEKAEKSIRDFLPQLPDAHPYKEKMLAMLQSILWQKIENHPENFAESISLCKEILSISSEKGYGIRAKELLGELEKKEQEQRQTKDFEESLAAWDRLFQGGKTEEAKKYLDVLQSKAITQKFLAIWEQRKETLAQAELKKELALCRYYEARELPRFVPPLAETSQVKAIPFMPGASKAVLEKPLLLKGFFFLPVAGYLHCLKAQDGSIEWSFYYGESESISWIILSGEKEVSESILADRILVSGIGGNSIKMFSLHSGSMLWETQLDTSITSPPLWAEGSLLLGCQNRFCYRIDPRGKILGGFLTKSPISQKPFFDYGTSLLYLSEKDQGYIFNTIQGQLKEYVPVKSERFAHTQKSYNSLNIKIESNHAQFLEESSRILVFDKTAKIYDTKTAQYLWTYQDPKKSFPGTSCTSWQKNGSLYFIGTQIGSSAWGHSMSLDSAQKELIWQRRIGAGFSAEPVISKKNFVWLSRNDGSLFQLATGKSSSIPRYRMTKGHPYWDVVTHLLYLPEKDHLVLIRNKGISKMIHASSAVTIQDWNFRESWEKAAPGLCHRDEEWLFFAPGNTLRAFSLISGRKVSKDYTGDSLFTTPLQYFKGSLFLGDQSGKFYRFQMTKTTDSIGFQKIWEDKNSHALSGTPAISLTGIYTGCENGMLSKLHPAQGKAQWRYQTDASIKSQPVLQKNAVFVGNESGSFYAISSQTGELLWQRKLQGPISATPVLENEKIYIVTCLGFLYALSEKDGSVLWQIQLPGKVQKALFLWNKTLYVASENDFIYTIQE